MDNFNYIEMIRNQIQRVALCQRKMRNWAKTFRAYEAGAPDLTLNDVKTLGRNAITQPSRCISKNQQIVTRLTNELGAQSAALALIDSTLASFHGGLFTRPEIVSKLNELKVYEDAIIAGVQSGWTMNDVATYLETNLSDDEDLATQPEETGWIQPDVGGVFV